MRGGSRSGQACAFVRFTTAEGAVAAIQVSASRVAACSHTHAHYPGTCCRRYTASTSCRDARTRLWSAMPTRQAAVRCSRRTPEFTALSASVSLNSARCLPTCMQGLRRAAARAAEAVASRAVMATRAIRMDTAAWAAWAMASMATAGGVARRSRASCPMVPWAARHRWAAPWERWAAAWGRWAAWAMCAATNRTRASCPALRRAAALRAHADPQFCTPPAPPLPLSPSPPLPLSPLASSPHSLLSPPLPESTPPLPRTLTPRSPPPPSAPTSAWMPPGPWAGGWARWAGGWAAWAAAAWAAAWAVVWAAV